MGYKGGVMKRYICFIFMAYFLGFITLTAQSPAEEKQPPCFALLIGINQYPKLANNYQLDGCRNDVELMQQMLLKRYSIPQENITTLLDEQATRAGILAQFSALIQKVRDSEKGTQVLFFYSGHGSQKKDMNGDESDGKDETLVSYDSSTDEGENDILDDEIEVFLQDLSEFQCYTTVLLDCCHSGSGIRGATKTRSLPRKIEAKANVNITKKEAVPGVVFISACQPFEKAIEHSADNGKKYGFLTYHFVKAVEKEGSNATYRSVFKQIHKFYSALLNETTPEIEGDSARFILGRKAKETPKLAKVSSYVDLDSKKEVELDNGLFLDITEGSIFCLLPDVEKIPQKGNLDGDHFLFRITNSDCFKSCARLLTDEERESYKQKIHPRFFKDQGELAHIVDEWDAVEIIHNYGDLRLKLYIEKESVAVKDKKPLLVNQPVELAHLPKNFQKMLTGLIEEKVLETVSDETKADVILRLGQKTAVLVWGENGNTSKESLPLTNPEQYEPTGFGGFLLEDTPENALELEKTLFHFNKVRNLLRFQPQEENLAVEVRLVKIKKNNGRWESDGDIEKTKDLAIEMTPGTKFGILFTNQSEEALYPTLICISSDLEIQVPYPLLGQSDYKVYPQDKKLFPFQATVPQFTGRENVKLLLTTEPIQLQTISMPRLEYKKNRSNENFSKETEKTDLGKYFLQMSFGEYRKSSSVGEMRSASSSSEDSSRWFIKSLSWKVLKEEKKD